MIKILYGESDLQKLRIGDYFYQDRTSFIETLEKWSSNYPVFLRPRRFGKSLFISVLHHYYGLEYKKDFKKIFGNLYIGQQPTELANSYMVLSLEFSGIDTSTHERTYKGFLLNVITSVRPFLGVYRQFFSDEDKRTILGQQSPEGVLKTLFSIAQVNEIPHKIYLLIDEYDHFANELLSFDLQRFKDDVSKNGFVHKFYESLKMATRQNIVERIFITGVSPIMLDSLTSGFNISSNISTNPLFHDMVGFTHQEVEALLRGFGIEESKIPEMMDVLTEWYDGYQFAPEAKQPLFNPDMMLYFLQEYSILNQYPEVMLDTNVVSDYQKIRNTFTIGGTEKTRYKLLEQLAQTGYIDFPLTRLYNLSLNFTQDDFLSLLFYMGMLSVKAKSRMGWRFEIPNYVIRKLYFEYFTAIQLEPTRFMEEKMPIREAINILLDDGNPEPFFKIGEEVLLQHHSNRDDMVYAEKHLQTLLIGLLCPYQAYFIHSEYESGRGYPDIFLERIHDVPMEFEVVMELKYVKKADEKNLAQIVKDAEIQLDGYMTSKRFARPDVRGFYGVFFCGALYKWAEWGKY